MLRISLSSVRHNLGRYIATLVAIITGVGFFTASGFIGARVTDALEGNVDRQYGRVSVAVVPDRTATADSSAAEGAPLRISGTTADRLDALPGAEASAGALTGRVAFLGDDGKAFATDATGRLWITDEELSPLQVGEGAAPSAAGQIAVDRGLAEEHGFAVGDRVTVLTLAGEEPATIVGITDFGGTDAIDGGGTVSIPAAAAFDWLNSGHREYDEYYLRGAGSEEELAAAAAAVLPAGYEARTGTDFRAEQRESSGAIGVWIGRALEAFAVLALLVGAFVIYNTFSVIVAQRLRELAVLAAIGATPRQIKRSLRLEGLVVGLLGSVLGVVTGFLLVTVLAWVVTLFGVDLPGSGLAFTPDNVIGGILLGTIITFLSVMVPARRAAGTEPIEAMRSASVEDPRPGRSRIVATLVLLVLGAAALLFGGGAVVIGLGALAFMVGVVLGGPPIALVGARLFRPLLERFGMEGRLAVDNSVRNPKRTATTANALLIGVFLVTLVAVAGTSVKDFAVAALNRIQSADYLVTSDGGTIDDAFVARLQRVPDVEAVVPFRRQPVTVDGQVQYLGTGDLPAMQAIANVRASQGSFDELGPGTIAVLDLHGDGGAGTDDGAGTGAGAGEGPVAELGDTVVVLDNRGKEQDLRVVALIAPSIDAAQVGSLVSRDEFDALVGDVAPTVAFVDVASGAQSATKEGIQDLANLRPDISVAAGNAVGQLVGTIFDFVIKAVTGLLLMSVLVALIGIVNTMSLSILERRRELGLLRIIGMTDDRVRRMITLESVLISLLGTLVGLLSGLFLALSLVVSINRLSEAQITPSLPVLELVGIVVVGVVLGVLAALIPARRSTRLEVLDAIAAT